VMRLSTVNYVLSQHRESRKLSKYLERSLQCHLFHDVELSELRRLCSGGATAFDVLFRFHHQNVMEQWYALNRHSKLDRSSNRCYFLLKKGSLSVKWLGLFVVLPLYSVSQALFLLLPFMLCIYHNVEGEVSVALRALQYVLTALYFVVFVAVLFLVPTVSRFTRITSAIHHHSILYFSSYHCSAHEIEAKMEGDVRSLYRNLVATQLRRDGLTALFGADICELVLSFLAPLHVVDTEKTLRRRDEMDEDIITQLNDFDEHWMMAPDDDEEVVEKLESAGATLQIQRPNASDDDGHHTDHSNMSLTPR